jgi:RNA polymerase sigma-70 factor (ECF subfamily)
MASVIDPESSFELLERAKSGDADALDRLLRRYLPPLRKWASGRLPRWARDLADTQDLVQETVLQALKHLKNFRPQHDGALQAYLRQAVMNRIRDELRRAHRRPAPAELQDSMPGSLVSPLEEAIGHEALERYEAALATLREDERAAIIARIEMGHSYAEVASALGKPTSDAARIAVYRALARLAAKMKHAV